MEKILEIDTGDNQIEKKCTTDNTEKCLENSILEKIKNL